MALHIAPDYRNSRPERAVDCPPVVLKRLNREVGPMGDKLHILDRVGRNTLVLNRMLLGDNAAHG